MKSGQHASVRGHISVVSRSGRSWAFRALALAGLLAAQTSCSGGANPAVTSDSGVGGRHDATGVPSDAKKPVDAGGCGASGPLCPNGERCTTASECESGACSSGVCSPPPPSCTDGVKDGQETDIDCGGSLCPACGTGKSCDVAKDCVSQVCTAGGCQAPTGSDGVLNDSETDVDCGGALLANGQPNPSSDGASPCGNGQTCRIGSDCTSNVCASGSAASVDGGADAAGGDAGATVLTCQPPTDHDGVLNDSETDVDCGGGLLASGQPNPSSDGAPKCAVGKGCLLGSDCTEGVCNANAGSGGGPTNCPAGATCTCQAPADNDTVKNDSETDVDCGGALLANGDKNSASDGAPGCATGKDCVLATDCMSKVCTSKKCAAPTDSDGVQNDSETDVDCGGGLLASGAKNTASDGASACADDKKCLLDTDCVSTYCSQVSHTCVDGQSCKGLVAPAQIMDVTTPASTTLGGPDAIGTPDPNGVGQSAGLDTCGTGEATDPIGQQTHESCCKSLPVTINGTSLRYDKYEVTSGRIRQFLE
jgi:hypothetical protein